MWQPALFIGGLMALATIIMFATHHFKQQNNRLSESLDDQNRTTMLVEEAMQRYPASTMLSGLIQFCHDQERLLESLRMNAEGADVLEAMKQVLRDRTLLLQEVSRLTRIETERVSGFNVLTSAQA